MMNKRLKVFLALSVCVWALAGCIPAKQNIYYWGKYEALIYDMYVKPGSADAVTQIQKLTTDIQQAESLGKKVPPGVYAHLGFMYALQGMVDESEAAFNEEKSLYPESKQFIDGMIVRAAKQRRIISASVQ